jgi:hypothetical protein
MAVKAEVAAGDSTTYFDWAPVWAGSAVAVAITLVLTQFGTGVGLGAGETMVDETTASWNVAIAGLWLALTAIAASAAGGYIAGRMRMPVMATNAEEREFRDGVHGLGVWAVGSIAALGLTTLITLASTAGAAGAETAAEVSDAVARYAHNGAIILAFSSAAASAIGVAAAWFAAEAGGKHRDENTSIAVVMPSFIRSRLG